MAAKMNQLLAIEKGVKSEVYGEITKLHQLAQKPELFEGMTRVFESTDADGEKLPPENKRVQLASGDVLRTVERKMTELFDIEARKDYTNTMAQADIVVGGVTQCWFDSSRCLHYLYGALV